MQTDGISSPTPPVVETDTSICSYLQNAHDQVYNFVSYLGRRVTYLSDRYLPHPINVIAKTAYATFPLFVLNATLPSFGFLLSIGAIVTYTILVCDNREGEPEGPSTLSYLGSSLQRFAALSFFYEGIRDISTFIRYGSTVNLILGISEAIFGTYSSFESGLGEELFQIRFRRSS